MFGGLFGRDRGDGNFQLAADDLGDIANANALIAYSMIARAGDALLEREAIDGGDVRAVGRGPAIGAVADIGGNALLPCDLDQVADEAGLASLAMYLRETDGGDAHALVSEGEGCAFGNAGDRFADAGDIFLGRET